MHDEHSRSRNELWLARQLQQAARDERPQFSESLHQRIMQAVRPIAAETTCAETAPVAERRKDAPRRRAYWLTAASLASAAAILAMVIAGRWFSPSDIRNDPQQPQSAVATSVAVQPVKSSAADTQPDDIAAAAANYTLDDLSRDAQATADLLVDQLPFETPADDWGL